MYVAELYVDQFSPAVYSSRRAGMGPVKRMLYLWDGKRRIRSVALAARERELCGRICPGFTLHLARTRIIQ